MSGARVAEAAGKSASVIVPVLNEEAGIAPLLIDLKSRWPRAELIVADGGSADGTVRIAARLADRFVSSKPGRARQMNAGAAAASRPVLLFLHADTRLPDGALEAVETALVTGTAGWGRFDVAMRGRHRLLPLVAAAMNARSRFTGVCTGDQAIFVRRKTFEQVGGFPQIALMEDIALSKRLRAISPPLCLRLEVTTSGRRWDANGFFRTVVIMWLLRLAYWLGVSPGILARLYDRMKSR